MLRKQRGWVAAMAGLLLVGGLGARVVRLGQQQAELRAELRALERSVQQLRVADDHQQHSSSGGEPVAPAAAALPRHPPTTVAGRQEWQEKSSSFLGRRPHEHRARGTTQVVASGDALQRDDCDGHRTSPGGPPLLILATTMANPGSDELKRHTTTTALRGMLQQTPADAVRPLVFTDSPELATLVQAETSGVHGGAQVTSSSFEEVQGWPTFRSMMKKAVRAQPSESRCSPGGAATQPLAVLLCPGGGGGGRGGAVLWMYASTSLPNLESS